MLKGADLSEISIRAPRGGSDWIQKGVFFIDHHFNPRSPWGERLKKRFLWHSISLFQSTLPVGGATSLPLRFWR